MHLLSIFVNYLFTLYRCYINNTLGSYMFQVKLQVDELKRSCGHVYNSYRVKRISGGKEVESIDRWPWQALITYHSNPWINSDSFCGGSIINRRMIITAYHCTVTSLITHSRIKKEDIIVTIGVYNRSLSFETTRQVLSVKEIHRVAFQISDDMAILELNQNIVFSHNVRPICLPTLSESTPSPGTECIISGYGRIAKNGLSSNVLRTVKVPIINWRECQARFIFDTSNTLCTTGSIYGRGACSGDSGGSLACLRVKTGQWVLMGVVFGGDCPAGVNIFSNVVKNHEWIRGLTKNVN